jgi:hypothetical protein
MRKMGRLENNILKSATSRNWFLAHLRSKPIAKTRFSQNVMSAGGTFQLHMRFEQISGPIRSRIKTGRNGRSERIFLARRARANGKYNRAAKFDAFAPQEIEGTPIE